MKSLGMLPRWSVGTVLALITSIAALATEDTFVSDLSMAQRQAAGLDNLTAAESAQLNQLVAADAARSHSLRDGTFALTFTQRHSETERQAAGLVRLSADQLHQLDELVATALADRPQPKERPRLKDNEVVSLARRLEVHGGMSFTYGWAGGGRNFREAGAWVSYYDPVTGIELAVGFSRFSGDLPFGYYGGYYPYDYGDSLNWSAARSFGTATRATISDRGGLFSATASEETFRRRGDFRGGGPGGRRF